VAHASKDPFAELKPPLSLDAALAEATRCLACYDAPCTRACPTHIDVPGFIKRIATGNLTGSARTILRSNVFGASCARVCPTEVLCEGACVFNHLGQKPIQIGLLQRHAMDAAMRRGLRPIERGARRPGRVAIIGAGPAGLSCAAELTRAGIEAVVFEAAPRPGGLNTSGVAEYKQTSQFALDEIKWLIEAGGLDVRYGTRVGTGPGEITPASLEAEYDAVFVGVGLGRVGRLGVEGDDLPGVLDAIDFIEWVKLDRDRARAAAGSTMVVIGGGNTSIDVVTQAARLGVGDVTLVYRRGLDEMPAYHHEVELAKSDGAKILANASPRRFVAGANGRVTSVELDRTRVVDGKLVATGEIVSLAADCVVLATGQKPHSALLASLPGVAVENGKVKIADRSTMQTSNPRWFAGGDCVSGGKEVVDAVAEGKRAAVAIAAMISVEQKVVAHG
jgi:glutamate synthase (NADPH/NADH) small chain